MNTHWQRIFLGCVLYCGLVALAGAAGPETTGTGGTKSREILLTFADRGLQRTPNAAPGRYLRRSSNYQSTAWSRAVAADIARDYSLAPVVEWPIRSLGVHCIVYRVSDSLVIEEVIARLRQDSRVAEVQRMNTFHALADRGDPYLPLQTSFSAVQIESVHQWTTGRDVKVAIIDTGIDTDHPDLAGQVARREDLTDNTSEFNDDIHGTAVAGIIGAISDNGLGIAGLAPDARLFALRACWPEHPGEIAAVCNSLTVARALDTAITLRPQVLNLSLTGPADPLVEALLRAALTDGLIVVAADPPGDAAAGFLGGLADILRVGVQQPADAPETSGRLPPVIPAPGREVLTTFPRGTYNFASGSSFAAANVSGIVALLLELQPGLSPAQVRTLLLGGMSPAAHGPGPAASIDLCRTLAQVHKDVYCGEHSLTSLLPEESAPARYAF